MVSRRQKYAIQYASLGLVVGILATAIGVAGYSLGTLQGKQDSSTDTATVLNALGASSGDTIALSTGPMDDVEGLFVLDYLTGDLQCWVISSRTGKFNALFKYNVTTDLGVEQGKKPDYVMVTGSASFRGGGVANNLGNAICYVADGNTGNVAAYAVPWNRAIGSQGGPQQGSLLRLDIGKARLAAIRNN